MTKTTPLLLAVLLSACGPSEAPKQKDIPTVEELASEPQRLKELRRQCITDRAALGDELCRRVAEATRKRFMATVRCPIRPRRSRPNSKRGILPAKLRFCVTRHDTPVFAALFSRFLKTETSLFRHFDAENGL